MKYLYDNLYEVLSKLRNKCAFLFLDYDGTLTPIVRTPKDALMPPETKKILRRLSKTATCRIAVISGRGLQEIKKLVGIRDIVYAGNHGFELEGPKLKHKVPLPRNYKTTCEKLKTDLKKNSASIKGVYLEDKGVCFAVHYRLVKEKDIPAVKSIFREITDAALDENKIRITSGKMVFEIRPPVDWDKGRVVAWLLNKRSHAFRDRPTFPVYIGDDLTDEDAFKSLKKSGLTIVVGKTKLSNAEYYVYDTKQVAVFLEMMLNAAKKLPQKTENS